MLHGFSPGIVSQGASAYLIEQSLLFNDNDSAYLNRTPSVTGNRKTWTWSGWMKRANIDAYQHFICAGPSGADFFVSRFGTTGKLELWDYSSATTHLKYITTAVFNDSSAWYHIVFAVDTTQATASNRVKIYVNGVQVTAFDTETDPSLNFDTHINSSSYKHEIGALTGSGANVYTDGLMALPILVDGSALAPTAFGEVTDDGFWDPIEFVPDTVGSNLTANYVTSVSNDGGGGFATSPVTFSSVDIGTASATRKVIVGVGIDGYQGNEAYTSLTIGGVAANLIQEQNAAAGGRPVALFELDVSSGTSADIVVTFTGTQTKCYSMGIGVWTIEGGTLFSTVGSTADPGVGDINVPAGGTVIAIMTEGNAAATYAWANLTENFDNQVRASRQAFSGASKDLSSYTTQAISANVSGGTQFAMLAASFAPAGGFGINGFRQDFADTADFGADVNYTGDTSVTFTDSSVNSGSATAYTFSSQAIGTASSDRVVAVGVMAGNSAAGINTLTVGGVSAVKAIDATNSTETELWYASVPSGTTADIVVTFSSGKGRCGIGVWALTGVTGVGATNTSTSSTATLTVPGRTKDIVLAVYGGKDHASVSFSGVTENYDEDISGANSQYQAGGSKKLTATGSNTITVTPNVGATEVAAVSAVFLATGNNGYINNNFVADDQLEDSPTSSADDGIGNFCTLNPYDVTTNTSTLSEGNTKWVSPSGLTDGGVRSTIWLTTGEWHWEVTINDKATNYCQAGIANAEANLNGNSAAQADFWVYDAQQGVFEADAVTSGSIGAVTNGDVVGFILDLDAATLKVYNDAGTLIHTASSLPADAYTPALRSVNAQHTFTCNFGQSTFANSALTQANAIATQNLPATHPLYTGTAAQYRAGAEIVSNAALGANTSGAETNTCQRQEIDASIMADQDANWIRVKFAAYTSEGWTMDQAYVGEKASSGNAWDFDGNQVQLTFNDSVSVTVPAGSTMWSDWVALSTTGSINKIVSCNVTSDTSNDAMARESGVSGYTRHAKNSSDEAGTTAPTGFTSNGTNLGFVKAIEVQ